MIHLTLSPFRKTVNRLVAGGCWLNGKILHITQIRPIMLGRLNSYQEPLIHKYEKDETEIIDRQIFGTSFKIMQNNNYRTVLWNPEEQIECTLATDCQEDVLYQILNSLFTLEVNQ